MRKPEQIGQVKEFLVFASSDGLMVNTTTLTEPQAVRLATYLLMATDKVLAESRC
jgi:hypothetical protein